MSVYVREKIPWRRALPAGFRLSETGSAEQKNVLLV